MARKKIDPARLACDRLNGLLDLPTGGSGLTPADLLAAVEAAGLQLLPLPLAAKVWTAGGVVQDIDVFDAGGKALPAGKFVYELEEDDY